MEDAAGEDFLAQPRIIVQQGALHAALAEEERREAGPTIPGGANSGGSNPPGGGVGELGGVSLDNPLDSPFMREEYAELAALREEEATLTAQLRVRPGG